MLTFDGILPVIFGMRLYFRYSMTRSMEVDDWLAVATFLAWIPFSVLGLYREFS
jgi:hypothetical protein